MPAAACEILARGRRHSRGPASIGLLNAPRLDLIEAMMVHNTAHRLWAFALVLAIALNLVGQGFMSAAMAVPLESASTAAMTTAPSNMCPGCEGADHSKAAASDCGVGHCSGVVAVLPVVPIVRFSPRATPFGVAEYEGQGITGPPAVGPPRPLHLT